jgi:hypothetical protein
VQILQQERHTAERSVRQTGARGVTAGVVKLRDYRIELRIDALDALDRGFDELERRDFALRHELSEADRVVIAVFGERHCTLDRPCIARFNVAVSVVRGPARQARRRFVV